MPMKSDNSLMASMASARFVRLPASATTTVRSTPGTLVRVVLMTNGGTVLIRNGSEVLGVIALDAPEGTYTFGCYCNKSIIVETGSVVDALVVFDD